MTYRGGLSPKLTNEGMNFVVSCLNNMADTRVLNRTSIYVDLVQLKGRKNEVQRAIHETTIKKWIYYLAQLANEIELNAQNIEEV